MKILNGAKKAAIFTAIKMPLSIVGWSTLVANNKFVINSLRALNAPTCPECLKGGMHCSSPEFEIKNSDDGSELKTLYPWKCSNKDCNFELYAPLDAKAARETISHQMIILGKQRLAVFNQDELNKRTQLHRFKSRFLWVIGILLFSIFLYKVGAGLDMTLCLGYLCIGFFASLNALIASYRAWQLETGTIFVEGAFQRFVINENWIR